MISRVCSLRSAASVALCLSIAVGLTMGVISPAAATYTWQDMHGPNNGDAQGIAWDDAHATLYRTVPMRGVYKYQNGAWTSLGGGIANYSARPLALDERNPNSVKLYAGTRPFGADHFAYGVWRCTNPDGETPAWTQICSDTDIGRLKIQALFYDSASNVLYAGCDANGVWRCTNPDGAYSWSQISTPDDIGSRWVRSFAYDGGSPHRLYVGAQVEQNSNEGGAWRCDNPDTSPTWTHISGTKDVWGDIDAMSYHAGKLYAALSGMGVWRCDNPTMTSYTYPTDPPDWVKISSHDDIGYEGTNGLYYYDGTSDYLYAASSIGIWRCSGADGGTWAWTKISPPNGWNYWCLAFDFNSNELWTGASSYGVSQCVYPDAANPQWADATGSPSTDLVSSMYYESSHDILYCSSSSGFWRCLHPATTRVWEHISTRAGYIAYDAARNIIYLGTWGGGIWRCTDPDGSSGWTNISESSEISALLIQEIAYDSRRNVLYAGISKPEYSTTPGGLWRCVSPELSSSWTKITTGDDVNDDTVYDIACDSERDILYVTITAKTGVWRCNSPSSTFSWTELGGADGAGNTGGIYEIAFDDNHNLLYAAGSFDGIFRCVNPSGSHQWQSMPGETVGMFFTDMTYDSLHNLLYVSTVHNGVLRGANPDGTADWTNDHAMNENKYQWMALGIDCAGNNLYGSIASMGAWSAALPGVSSLGVSEGTRGRTLNVEVVGSNTHFVKSQSQVVFSGDGITVNSTKVEDDTHLSANITIATDAPLGTRDVDVITPKEETDALVGGFTVKPIPSITSLSPTSGYTGNYITVGGSGFGTRAGNTNYYVKFGNVKATAYSYWADNKIRVKVPSGAYKACNVVVYTPYGKSNPNTFKVKPKITSISPTSGKRTSRLTIYGTAFCPTRYASCYVKFGATKASTYYSWSNTRIVVRVPSASYGRHYVRVTTPGGTSTGKTFMVKR